MAAMVRPSAQGEPGPCPGEGKRVTAAGSHVLLPPTSSNGRSPAGQDLAGPRLQAKQTSGPTGALAPGQQDGHGGFVSDHNTKAPVQAVFVSTVSLTPYGRRPVLGFSLSPLVYVLTGYRMASENHNKMQSGEETWGSQAPGRPHSGRHPALRTRRGRRRSGRGGHSSPGAAPPRTKKLNCC